jgi:hypothetical protein
MSGHTADSLAHRGFLVEALTPASSLRLSRECR